MLPRATAACTPGSGRGGPPGPPGQGLTCGQHAMDLADLPEALPAVVFQWCPLVEVHCHWELPGLNLPGGTGSGMGDDLSPGLSPPLL